MDTRDMQRSAIDELNNVTLGLDIRRLFPVFAAKERNQSGRVLKLGYLDSAASSQKPSCVIERLSRYFSFEHANIHRGAYGLSAEATCFYEDAREKVKKFIGAPTLSGVIFTKGATESINLVRYSLRRFLKPGDVVLVSLLEHHSNIVPWQLMAQDQGIQVAFTEINQDGSLNTVDFRKKLKELRPKLCAITQLANSLGTVVPVGELLAEAKQIGALTLVDAAQSIPHTPIDVKALGSDFLAFSGHKMYGPTGIGILYASERALAYMEPFQGGGDMISSVSVDGSTWAEPPQKFEAGTPPIAEAIGLGVAVDFLQAIGMKRIAEYEHAIFAKAWNAMRSEPGIELYGPANSGGAQSSIISFNVAGVHAHDLATIADEFNIQIRAGHHCAMPTLRRLGLQATARASIGIYSTIEDFEILLESIRYAKKVFA